MLNKIKHFLKNIWTLREILINYRWWDYETLLDVNAVMLEDMAKNTKKKGHSVNSDKKAIEMEKIANIFRHESQDNYINIGRWHGEPTDRGIYRLIWDTESIKKPHIPFSKKYLLRKADETDNYRIRYAYKRLARVVNTFWD